MAAITLYPYQKRWLKDKSRFKAGMFARQTGKTFTTTLEVVDDCAEKEAGGGRARWVLLSRGERQAKEAMEEGIKRHLQAYQISARSFDGRCEWAPEANALEVRLPGGSRITALPSNPDTARGFAAGVVADEFGFHADSREIWKALFPVVSAGHRMRVISTPNGRDNVFHTLMTDQSLNGIWSRHQVDIYQAVAEGLPRNIEELRQGLNDEDAWLQEYMLQFTDEGHAWLTYDLITSCEHEQAGIPALYQGGPCYTGEDIGARNDLHVLWIDELVGDVLWCREIIIGRRISFAEQDERRADMFRRYRVIRHCMDQTGMGEKPVQDAQRAHGRYKVEGVLFNNPNKHVLAVEGKEAFEKRRRRIPMDDQPLRSDLHKLQKETTATGAPRFVAESDAAGHSDRAWACFLATHAAGKPAAATYKSISIPGL